jgi:maltose O-acetyltransferase
MRHLRILILSIAALSPLPDRCRRPLLRLIGLRVAPDCGISAGLRLTGGTDVTIGPGAFIQVDVAMQADAPITIGARAQVGSYTQLITADHEVGPSSDRIGSDRPRPIVVGEGVWLGAGSIVLAGVTIGAGCIIGAGSVVTRDCRPDTIYAGLPARAIRALPVESEDPKPAAWLVPDAVEPDQAA